MGVSRECVVNTPAGFCFEIVYHMCIYLFDTILYRRARGPPGGGAAGPRARIRALAAPRAVERWTRAWDRTRDAARARGVSDSAFTHIPHMHAHTHTTLKSKRCATRIG